MNNKEFVANLSKDMNISVNEVQKRIDVLNTALVGLLDEKDSLTIKGFGNFEIKKRLERVVTNPSTQQKMLVPPKLSLVFKPSLNFKEIINEEAKK